MFDISKSTCILQVKYTYDDSDEVTIFETVMSVKTKLTTHEGRVGSLGPRLSAHVAQVNGLENLNASVADDKPPSVPRRSH